MANDAGWKKSTHHRLLAINAFRRKKWILDVFQLKSSQKYAVLDRISQKIWRRGFRTRR